MGHVKRDARSYSLEELGITDSRNVLGEDRLTIALPPNSLLGAGQVQAVFDSSKRKWELGLTTNAKFSSRKNDVFERRDAVPAESRFRPRTVPWTQGLPRTEYADSFLNDIDWDRTPLGPLESWSITLQVYLNLVLADDEPAVIYWGEDLCALYNASFYQIVTDRLTKPHELLGMPFAQMWPELWSDFKPMFDSIAARGVGIEALEVNLFPVKNGIPEETFWSSSFLPIRNQSGIVQGFYNRARESTMSVISERRAKLLSAISAKPNLTGDFIFQHLLTCFAVCEKDFPLIFIYSAQEDTVAASCILRYQGGSGVPAAGHPLLPSEIDLFEGKTGFVPYFRKAKSKDAVLVLQKSNHSLPDHLLADFQWKGFGEQSRSIAVLPISTSDRLLAILVVGLNPRRPFDEDYEGFLNTLQRSISATVASSIDREEARARAERLAKQLELSERSIREIAEYGPVGIMRYSLAGKVVWANDQFYEITGHGRADEDHYDLSFLDLVVDEDREAYKTNWTHMSVKHEKVNVPVRLKKTWQPPRDPNTGKAENHNVWVLASGYPIGDGGEVKAFAGSVTDISRFKWAETVQSRSAAAAKEAKRLQEIFMDMVSHEMRNPLSAITQLAGAILPSLEEYESLGARDDNARALLASNVDNANTILLCAAHQKRVIDDVLTLSKLDSMMLSVTPVVVQPDKRVEQALKMFEAEFRVNKITVRFEKKQSYKNLQVEWVCIDPSRLTQISINLITNAVKFTKLEPVREINVSIGASLRQPTSLADVKWFPSHRAHKDLTDGPEWGKGEPVFICIEIQDTGRGLEQAEMKKLFGRFQQGNEQLKHQYGGSGLGLFISRELTETQGGEIGVRSEPHKGTTFAFYVKGRRAEAPKDAPESTLTMSDAGIKTFGPRETRDQKEKARSSLSNVGERTGRSSFRVLLVEDNAINSRILKQQLRKAGCDVLVANHGAEALDLLAKSQAWKGKQTDVTAANFDVILMDTEMPIMDGLTCTRRIRQLESEGTLQRHMNIIATTASGSQESADKATQAGADDVLSKPFEVAECLGRIQTLLEKDGEASRRQRRG